MRVGNRLLTWAARKPLWHKIDSYIAYQRMSLSLLSTVLKGPDKIQSWTLCWCVFFFCAHVAHANENENYLKRKKLSETLFQLL